MTYKISLYKPPAYIRVEVLLVHEDGIIFNATNNSRAFKLYIYILHGDWRKIHCAYLDLGHQYMKPKHPEIYYDIYISMLLLEKCDWQIINGKLTLGGITFEMFNKETIIGNLQGSRKWKYRRELSHKAHIH
jgi:hypothetical protein